MDIYLHQKVLSWGKRVVGPPSKHFFEKYKLKVLKEGLEKTQKPRIIFIPESELSRWSYDGQDDFYFILGEGTLEHDHLPQHSHFIDQEQLNEGDILDLFEMVVFEFDQRKGERLSKISEKNMTLLKDRLIAQFESNKSVKLKEIETYNRVIETLYADLSGNIDLSSLSTSIQSILGKTHFFREIHCRVNLADEMKADKNSFIFYIPIKELDWLLIHVEVKKDSLIPLLLILDTIRVIYFLRGNHKVKISKEEELCSVAFQKLKHPLALMNEMDEIIKTNNYFTALNLTPKKCLAYQNGDHFEYEERVFKISRKNFVMDNAKFSFFVFIEINISGEERVNLNKAQELGIISSSLAHELNNPIAGILAALTVLEFDPNFKNESIIEEMKESALRCKQLVETFLGFSKTKPNVLEEISIAQCISQAMNLLRFRMVDSGLSLNLDMEVKKDFEYPLNQAVCAMIFYIIFSDLLTHYGHFHLISFQDDNINRSVKGIVTIDGDSIRLSFDAEMNLKDFITSKVLFEHLVRDQRLQFKVNEKDLILKRA